MIEKDYYENEAFWAEEVFTENKEETIRLNRISELLPKDIVNLLDVGCGNGAFMKFLETNNFQRNMTGLERSKVAIKNKTCSAEIIEGSADALNFKNESFDTLLSLEVIEHLPFSVYEKTLEELQRVSSKYVIISVPYKEKERLIECNYCYCQFSPYFHLRSFNEKKMKKLLAEYSLVKMEKIGPYKEYYIWDNFKKYWYTKIKGNKTPMPCHSSCPQCGFNDNRNNEIININYTELKNNKSRRNKILEIIRKMTPQRTNYRWICGVYLKNKK